VKKLIIAAATLFCSTGAYAADLYPKATPAPQFSPAYNWNNIWVGGFVGAAVDTGGIDVLNSDGSTLLNNLGSSPAGFMGGGDIGANFQVIPRWVLGVYIEQAFASIRSGSNVLGVIDVNHSTNYIGAAGARLGFLITDSTLLYGKAGFAWGGAHAEFNAAQTLAQKISETSTGWQAGLGIEHRVSWAPNWSIGLEYDHVRLGEKQTNLSIDNETIMSSLNKFRFEEFRVFGRYNF